MTKITTTLEELENDFWKPLLVYPTKLVENIFILRKKPLSDFNSNDFRLLISQNVGLKYLIPEALKVLEKNLLEDSLYFPGDLLQVVLNINENYWIQNETQKKRFINLLQGSYETIKEYDNLDDEIKNNLISAIINFTTKQHE